MKNLPNLLTQVNMEVWGRDDEGKTYQLGDFVLHDDKLCPTKDPKVKGLKLKTLDPDALLIRIQIQLLGRKPDTTGEALRQQAKIDLSSKKTTKKAADKKNGNQAIAEGALSSTKLEFPDDPLWT